MTRCEFIATEVPAEYRCRRCGTVRSSPHSPERIHRWCSVINLAEPPAVEQGSRGLGDTVARMVDALTLGQAAKIAEATTRALGREDCGCNRRREWLNRLVPYRQEDSVPLTAAGSLDQGARSLLLHMPHGFGDAVQLTVVLRHLRHYYSQWSVDIAAKLGAHSLFAGLCRQAYVSGNEPAEHNYTLVRTLAWDEPEECYADSPATKAERCLREVFQVQPLDALCRYQIQTSAAVRERARDYLTSITGAQAKRFPVVIFHYQGNSAVQQKTLDEELVARLVRQSLERGQVPVILDWDRRSSLAKIPGVHCPGADHPLWQGTGTGDGETMAALIGQATAMLAVDSGPGHVAGATDTPTLVVWSGHHPLQFYCLAPNVRHAIPANHAENLRSGHAGALNYFEHSYDYRLYVDLRRALPDLFAELLSDAEQHTAARPGELICELDLCIRRAHRAADRMIVRDVYLEDCYGVDRLPWQPRYVVDVGAHLGAFTRRVERRLAEDARVICVEADPQNLAALESNVGRFAKTVPAACHYGSEPIRLHSTIYPGTDNTGASHVADAGEVVPRTTLERLLDEFELPWIDVLKLDCEGCEFSILEHATVLDRVRLIVGEWHDRARFQQQVARRLADWRLTILRDGELGLFWLENPRVPRAFPDTIRRPAL